MTPLKTYSLLISAEDKHITQDSGVTSHMLNSSALSGIQGVDTAKAREYIVTSSKGRVGNLSDLFMMDVGVLTEGIASVTKLDLDSNFVLFGKHLFSPRTLRLLRRRLSELVGKERALLGKFGSAVRCGADGILDLYYRKFDHRNRRDLGYAITRNCFWSGTVSRSEQEDGHQ